MQSRIIKHSEIDKFWLEQAIHIKSIAWPFPYESQLRWIEENITDNDYHLFYTENDKVYSYMNLIQINVRINKQKHKAFGVGNVCASEKSKGYGSKVMQIANEFILKQNIIGVLFCKENLVPFYNNFGWTVVQKDIYIIPDLNEQSYVMTYNFDDKINSLEYKGKLF